MASVFYQKSTRVPPFRDNTIHELQNLILGMDRKDVSIGIKSLGSGPESGFLYFQLSHLSGYLIVYSVSLPLYPHL